MNDELFDFAETDGGYSITRYNEFFQSTEIAIPSEHEGKPVVAIGEGAFGHSILRTVNVPEGIRRLDGYAFHNCLDLRRASLPASLETLGRSAFGSCFELREVEFKSSPSFGDDVFEEDFKLPAELCLASLVCSLDITQPLNQKMLYNEISFADFVSKYERDIDYTPWFRHRPDVFALAAQNDCFREIGAELLDILMKYCVREHLPEITAYLLELKRRKFGFKGGSDFEL